MLIQWQGRLIEGNYARCHSPWRTINSETPKKSVKNLSIGKNQISIPRVISICPSYRRHHRLVLAWPPRNRKRNTASEKKDGGQSVGGRKKGNKGRRSNNGPEHCKKVGQPQIAWREREEEKIGKNELSRRSAFSGKKSSYVVGDGVGGGRGEGKKQGTMWHRSFSRWRQKHPNSSLSFLPKSRKSFLFLSLRRKVGENKKHQNIQRVNEISVLFPLLKLQLL